MGKLSVEEMESIIRRDVPGHQLVRESVNKSSDRGGLGSPHLDAASDAPKSDAVSPGLDALRQKLRARSAAGGTVINGSLDSLAGRSRGRVEIEGGRADDADDAIVAVRPDTSASPYDSGYRTKAVIISGRSKKVIGRQG